VTANFRSGRRRHNRNANSLPTRGGTMSDPWPQDEREDKEAQPVADEPERQSDIVELDDDWED